MISVAHTRSVLLSSAVETSTGAKSPPQRLPLSSQAQGKLPRFEEARAHHHLPSFLLLLPPILPFSFLPNSLEKLAQLVPHNHSLFKSSPTLPAACGSCAHNIMLEILPAAKHANVVVLGYEHAAFDNGTGFNNLFFRCIALQIIMLFFQSRRERDTRESGKCFRI